MSYAIPMTARLWSGTLFTGDPTDGMPAEAINILQCRGYISGVTPMSLRNARALLALLENYTMRLPTSKPTFDSLYARAERDVEWRDALESVWRLQGIEGVRNYVFRRRN